MNQRTTTPQISVSRRSVEDLEVLSDVTSTRDARPSTVELRPRGRRASLSYGLPRSARERGTLRLQLAGQRPSIPAVATNWARLHLSLLRDLQRVIDLDAKVSDGALSELI